MTNFTIAFKSVFITSLFPLERLTTLRARVRFDSGVDTLVSLEGSFLSEGATALLTTECSLSRVYDRMVFQRLAGLEGDTAHVTAELAHLRVHDALVHSHSSCVRVLLATLVARYRSPRRVHPLVRVQTAPVRKELATHFTDYLLCTFRMFRLLVPHQGYFILEQFSTDITHDRVLLRVVSENMNVQVIFLCERFLANRTRIRLLPGM